MLAIAFSPLHAAAGRFVTRALAHFNPSAAGRCRAAYGALTELRGGVLRAAGRGTGVDVLAVSPTPPSRESRPGAFGAALEERGAHSFCKWGKSGSAENPWKSGFCRAKSLIPQANPSTSRSCFSTGCRGFSTGRILTVRPAPLSFSLSKSLKEKEKEQGKRQAEHAQGHPQVEGVFPRVPTPAYFFIHGFHGSERANLWKSVEQKSFSIKDLCASGHASTDPQVALPVLPPCRAADSRGRP
ncbi:hypothetical protein LMG18102_03236 [Ralstonia mannitolilytica]|nr:hypothetical protein LMG18102_03236 [Ralstonia mannitolilytica]